VIVESILIAMSAVFLEEHAMAQLLSFRHLGRIAGQRQQKARALGTQC
jgi:hypothetical protein